MTDIQWGPVVAIVAFVLGAFGGIVKLLLSSVEARLDGSINGLKVRIAEVEHDLKLLPENYVRREDWMRQMSRLEDKIDRLMERLHDMAIGGKAP